MIVLEDVFALQDDVTRAIVAIIAPQIELAEEAKAARRRPDNLSAYEIARRAWANAWQGHDKADRTLLEQSIIEAKKALEIDPNSVMALHVLTWAYGAMLFLHLVGDRDAATQNAVSASTRAIELDRMDAYGYSLRALGVWQRGELNRFPEALADARRSHELNPNDATVLRTLGILEGASGEPELAIRHLHELLRRNPRDPRCHQTYAILAGTSFAAKQYAEGVQWALRALSDRPQLIPAQLHLTLCLVGMDEIEKARSAFQALQKVAPSEFVASRLEGVALIARKEVRARQTTFLRVAAGLEDPSAAEPLR